MKRWLRRFLRARGYAPVRFLDDLTWVDFAGPGADEALRRSCRGLDSGSGDAWANAEGHLWLVDARVPNRHGSRKCTLKRNAALEQLFQKIHSEQKAINYDDYGDWLDYDPIIGIEFVTLWRVHPGHPWDLALDKRFWNKRRTRRILGRDQLRLHLMFEAVNAGLAAVYVDQRGRFHVQQGTHIWMDTGLASVAALLPQNALVRDDDSIFAVSSLFDESITQAIYPLEPIEVNPDWPTCYKRCISFSKTLGRTGWTGIAGQTMRLRRRCRQADQSWGHSPRERRFRTHTYFCRDSDGHIFESVNGFIRRCREIEICYVVVAGRWLVVNDEYRFGSGLGAPWFRVHPKTTWPKEGHPPRLSEACKQAAQVEVVIADVAGNLLASDGTTILRQPLLDVLHNHPATVQVPRPIVELLLSCDELAEQHSSAQDACYEANDLCLVADLDSHFFDQDPETNQLRRQSSMEILGHLPFGAVQLRQRPRPTEWVRLDYSPCPSGQEGGIPR